MGRAKRASEAGMAGAPPSDALVALRRELHANPDLSNAEGNTARIVKAFLRRWEPDTWVEGLGGEGFAVVYEGATPGPRVLLRADLDALPLPETIALEHGSLRPGVSHKCGHDGHMAILAGLAPSLHRCRPARGAAILLFQPAEETGEGAARVLRDAGYQQLMPDLVFALHNLPGFALGAVVVRDGPFASGSKGLVVELRGATSHAAEPHRGRSPSMAVAHLIQGLSAGPQLFTALHEAAQITVVGARLGGAAFGTSPGSAEVMATLRAHAPAVMGVLTTRTLELVHGIARAHGLEVAVRWTEEFPATINDAGAVARVQDAAKRAGLDVVRALEPFPWSEDFGHFTSRHAGALFGLGAGDAHPALHHPAYDFPDALLSIATPLLEGLLREEVGSADAKV